MPDYGKPIENDLNFNSLLDFFKEDVEDVEKDFPGTKGPKKGGGPSRTDKGGVKKPPLYGNPNPKEKSIDKVV